MITITRFGKGAFLAKLKVVIDNEVIGILKYKDTKTFDIPPGTHTLYIKMDWIKSEPIEFTLKEGQDLKFICAIVLNGVTTFKEAINHIKNRKYRFRIELHKLN